MADVSNSNSNNIWNAVDLAKLPNNWNARPDDMLGESQSSYLTNPRRRKMRTSWVVGVDFAAESKETTSTNGSVFTGCNIKTARKANTTETTEKEGKKSSSSASPEVAVKAIRKPSFEGEGMANVDITSMIPSDAISMIHESLSSARKMSSNKIATLRTKKRASTAASSYLPSSMYSTATDGISNEKATCDFAKLPDGWNCRPDTMLGESQSSYLSAPRRTKLRSSWIGDATTTHTKGDKEDDTDDGASSSDSFTSSTASINSVSSMLQLQQLTTNNPIMLASTKEVEDDTVSLISMHPHRSIKIKQPHHTAKEEQTAPKRRGRSRTGRGATRQRSGSLTVIENCRHFGTGGREAKQLPEPDTFTSRRSQYLAAMKDSNEKGIDSCDEKAVVGEIAQGVIHSMARPRRKMIQRTRSRSLTMLDGRVRRARRYPTQQKASELERKERERPKLRHTGLLFSNKRTSAIDFVKKQKPAWAVKLRPTAPLFASRRASASDITAKTKQEVLEHTRNPTPIYPCTQAPTHKKPQRTRSKSLMSVKVGNSLTRSLISTFDKNDGEVTMVAVEPPKITEKAAPYCHSNIVSQKETDLAVSCVIRKKKQFTKCKPQRARSRSLTSIRPVRFADAVSRSTLDYSSAPWVSLKSRSATIIQTLIRGFIQRRRWILSEPQLRLDQIRRQKLAELQRIEEKKQCALREVRIEMDNEYKARKKQIKLLVKERTKLEKEWESAQKTRNNWRLEICKQKDEAIRLADTKRTDDVVTVLNSSAVTGLQVEKSGTKKRIKAIRKEVESKLRELRDAQMEFAFEREWKRDLEQRISSIVQHLGDKLGVDDGLVKYVATFSGISVHSSTDEY